MGWFLSWVVFAIIVGVAASSRGRSGFAWFVLAVVISPVLAAILLALMPSMAKPAAEALALDAGELRKCPECAELIRREARKCKHCGSAVEPLLEPTHASERGTVTFEPTKQTGGPHSREW